MVGGLVVNGLTDDRYACASQAICDYLYSYYGASDGRMPFFTSNNIALSRFGFMRLGGFDPSFVRAAAEDRDFGLRWRETGGELVYAEDAIIDHFHGMSFAAFWRQHTNYGAGAVNLHNMMRQRGIMRKEFEPASFYLGLVSWPLRKYGPRRLDLSILIALSQIAMVNGYFLKARQNERHSIAA
jgi:GT2 family glycosyltransferase